MTDRSPMDACDDMLIRALREDPGFAQRYEDAIDRFPELESAREALRAAFPERFATTDKEN